MKHLDKIMTNAMDIILIVCLPVIALAMLITAAVTMQIAFWVLFAGSAFFAVVSILYFKANKRRYKLTDEGIVIVAKFKKRLIAYTDVKGIAIIGGYVQAGRRRSNLEEQISLNGEEVFYEPPRICLFDCEVTEDFCYNDMLADDVIVTANGHLLASIPFDEELLAKLAAHINTISISAGTFALVEEVKGEQLTIDGFELKICEQKMSYSVFAKLVSEGSILTLCYNNSEYSFTRNVIYRKGKNNKTVEAYTYSILGRPTSYDSLDELVEKEKIFEGDIKEKWTNVTVL